MNFFVGKYSYAKRMICFTHNVEELSTSRANSWVRHDPSVDYWGGQVYCETMTVVAQ